MITASPPHAVGCVAGPLSATGDPVRRDGGGAGDRVLRAGRRSTAAILPGGCDPSPPLDLAGATARRPATPPSPVPTLDRLGRRWGDPSRRPGGSASGRSLGRRQPLGRV